MNLNPLIIYDYREEFHAKIFRIWLIANLYGFNKNNKKILTLDKLHLFDFFLCNGKYIDLFVDLKKTNDSDNNLLYKSNILYGEHYNLKPTLSAIGILKSNGFIEVENINGTFYCFCTDKKLVEDEELIKPWIYKLKSLKPLLSKSTSNINKKLLEAQ